MLQATSFGLFTLFALATIIAATPEPDQVVPEMLENVAPVAPVGEPQASTPGHYTVTQDGSYTVKNENYANDTPAPYPDTPPAPGSMGMARGIDRNDRSRSHLPIFHWTWTNFMESVGDMNSDSPSGGGHEYEVWVDGDIHMVPDQMYMAGPTSECESASSAKVTIISSGSEMSNYEASSVSAGYDQEVDVGVEADIPGTGVGVSAETTLQTKMMIGSSSSSQEYDAAAKSGQDMSAFATITSWNYDVFLKNVTSFSPEFNDQITKLKSDSSDANMRQFFSLFGTDYLYAAKLGGKVTQQSSTTSNSDSTSQSEDLSESSSVSFAYNFMKLDSSSEAARSDTVANNKQKDVTTHKARFEGGEPNEDWMEWCQSTAKDPFPVSFQTRSVASLVEQDAPGLAAKLENFLVARLERIEDCEGQNSGMQYDADTGECIVGECGAGSYQVTCDSNAPEYTVANKCQDTDGLSLLSEAECRAYVTANGKTEYATFVGTWPTDCTGCTDSGGTVSFNTNPNAECTSTFKTVCKTDCAPTSVAKADTALSCHVCEAGKFQPDGEDRCDDCPVGKYADEPMTAQTCKSCQDGKTSATGATSCPFVTGAYYITNDDGCSLRPASTCDDCEGDSERPTDSGKWAVFDCNTATNKIQIEHISGDKYTLKSGTRYFGDADQATGEVTGDESWCSDGGTWGYFGTRTKQVTLEAGSFGTFKIKSPHNQLALGECSEGDSDKEANTKWAQFGVDGYLNFAPAN